MQNTTTGTAPAVAATKPCTCQPPDSLAAARRQFETLARTALKPCERFICRDRDFEDRRQEGLGRCWEWYSRQVASGAVPDTALVAHATRLAMVNRDRSLVGHEHRPRHDVYDRQGRDVELRRLDMFRDHDDDERRHEDTTLGLARLGVRDPTEHLVSGMDLETWLGVLADDDRELMELRAAGFGFKDIGKATGRSTSGAFCRARQLGGELAERAGLRVRVNGRGRLPGSSTTRPHVHQGRAATPKGGA